MNPYLHAAGNRGEGFRVDDIEDLDRFAADAAAIESVLNEHQQGKRSGWRGRFDLLLSLVRRQALNPAEHHEDK